MSIMRKKKSSTLPAMNDDEKLLYALDIGASKLRLIAGRVDEPGHIKIVGFLESKSAGIVQCSITSMEMLTKSIASLILNYQNTFRVSITDIAVGVPGYYILAENHHGTATIQTGQITEDDIANAVTSARAGVKSSTDENYTTIHLIPQNFWTESSNLVQNPLNMFAKRLDVNVHIIGCNSMYMKNIESAIKMTNSEIDTTNVIYEGVAASYAVLTEQEKDIGVIELDIGDGSVCVSVFESNRQLVSFGIPDGGSYLTKNIAKAFSISMAEAERLKCTYGIAEPSRLDPKEYEDVLPLSDGSAPVDTYITKIALCSQIRKSLDSMLSIILQKIVEACGASLDKLNIGAGVVLTGGTAKLPYIEQVISERISRLAEDPTCRFLTISSKVRIGHPRDLSIFENAGDRRAVSDTDSAVAVGLLRAARFNEMNQLSKNDADDGDSNNPLKKVRNFFKHWAEREL